MLAIRGPQYRRAATAVEMAFVIMTLLLFFLGIFEYCLFIATKQVMDSAARTAVRYAVVNSTTATTTNIQDTTDSLLGGLTKNLQGYNKYTSISVFHADKNGNNIGTDWNNAKFGEGIGIQISATYTPMLPSFLKMNTSFPLQTTVVMNSEAN
jgi:Flp pilus assembly protein TadG